MTKKTVNLTAQDAALLKEAVRRAMGRQVWLADDLGVSRSTISQWKRRGLSPAARHMLREYVR